MLGAEREFCTRLRVGGIAGYFHGPATLDMVQDAVLRMGIYIADDVVGRSGLRADTSPSRRRLYDADGASCSNPATVGACAHVS